jgi:hypothetical protein
MTKHILIADDSSFLREHLRLVIERHPGWEVCEAVNGAEAVRKSQQLAPDAVVLDLTMPEMDGLATGLKSGRKVARLSSRSSFPEAAARLRLQKIGEAGKGSSECICFPEDEQPFFRTSEESDLAAGVQCPLHGTRFTPRFHIYVAAWRWVNEVKSRWPRLSAQYHKAWAANSRCTVPLRLARPLSPVSVDPGKLRP